MLPPYWQWQVFDNEINPTHTLSLLKRKTQRLFRKTSKEWRFPIWWERTNLCRIDSNIAKYKDSKHNFNLFRWSVLNFFLFPSLRWSLHLDHGRFYKVFNQTGCWLDCTCQNVWAVQNGFCLPTQKLNTKNGLYLLPECDGI